MTLGFKAISSDEQWEELWDFKLDLGVESYELIVPTEE